jgi:outer membrane protein OmpA-like peptidoglycan-associated protein
MTVRARRGLVQAAVFAATAGFVATAQAQLQNAPVDLEIFRPAMDSKGFITINSSAVLGQYDFSFGLVTSYARRPLSLTGNGTFTGPDQPGVALHNSFTVDNLVRPSLQAAMGFTKLPHLGIEVGIIVPMGVVAGRSNPSDQGMGATSLDNHDWTYTKQGLGDIQLHPKIRLMNATRNGLGFAVIPSVILGTGDKNSFLGEGQTIFQPTAVLDTELGYLGRFRAAINGGMRIRSHNARFVDNAMAFDSNAQPVFHQNGMAPPVDITTGAGIELHNEFIGGVGLSYGIVPQKFDIVGEVYGNYGANSLKINPDGTTSKLGLAAEAVAGIKLYLARNSFFEIGAGYKVADSYGAAAPRAFIGFIFEPSIGDRDGDGYKDDVDQCPDDPEDFDDFEDEDGCPDPDNDKDGIPDVDDKCPNDPETKNGYQDADGCPDNTTFDRDGDGIPDDIDKCPDDPEDKDNFEDADGCPDPDNDKDGIPDKSDLCPNDPEDKDNFEDADGCPDPDNDHDRILDANDKCPNEPETYNGYQDADGCPDKGKVIVRKGKLEILDKIYFETDKDIIKPESFPLLDAIAATINGNPQIDLIEIQGHADERGDDAHNLDLTERRALSVRRALEERNVLPSRLKSHGYGETKPVCMQHNEDCWSKNRRVEFIILKRSDEAKLQGGEGQ